MVMSCGQEVTNLKIHTIENMRNATLEQLEYATYPATNINKVVPVTPKALPERAHVGSER